VINYKINQGVKHKCANNVQGATNKTGQIIIKNLVPKYLVISEKLQQIRYGKCSKKINNG